MDVKCHLALANDEQITVYRVGWNEKAEEFEALSYMAHSPFHVK